MTMTPNAKRGIILIASLGAAALATRVKRRPAGAEALAVGLASGTTLLSLDTLAAAGESVLKIEDITSRHQGSTAREVRQALDEDLTDNCLAVAAASATSVTALHRGLPLPFRAGAMTAAVLTALFAQQDTRAARNILRNTNL